MSTSPSDVDQPPRPPGFREIGMLVCILLRGRNLYDSSKSTSKNIYCVSRLRNSGSGRSDAVSLTGGYATWDDEFHIPVYVKGNETAKLDILVFAEEGGGADQLLGEAEVEIKRWPNNEFDEWVPLARDGKLQGEVELELTFYPPLPETTLPRKPVNTGAPANTTMAASSNTFLSRRRSERLVVNPQRQHAASGRFVRPPIPAHCQFAADVPEERTEQVEQLPYLSIPQHSSELLPLPGEPDSTHSRTGNSSFLPYDQRESGSAPLYPPGVEPPPVAISTYLPNNVQDHSHLSATPERSSLDRPNWSGGRHSPDGLKAFIPTNFPTSSYSLPLPSPSEVNGLRPPIPQRPLSANSVKDVYQESSPGTQQVNKAPIRPPKPDALNSVNPPPAPPPRRFASSPNSENRLGPDARATESHNYRPPVPSPATTSSLIAPGGGGRVKGAALPIPVGSVGIPTSHLASQASIVARAQQEKEDAEMAAALSAQAQLEDEQERQQKAIARCEREKRDAEYARKEEEAHRDEMRRLELERQRMDEEMARKEEEADREEMRRLRIQREKEDEELARKSAREDELEEAKQRRQREIQDEQLAAEIARERDEEEAKAHRDREEADERMARELSQGHTGHDQEAEENRRKELEGDERLAKLLSLDRRG